MSTRDSITMRPAEISQTAALDPLAAAGVMLIDAECTIVVASQGTLDLLGYAGPELANRRFRTLIPALQREQVIHEVEAALRGHSAEYSATLTLVRTDRTGIDLQIRVTVLKTENRAVGALVTADPIVPPTGDGAGPHAAFTPRQRQVMSRLLDGVTVQEIGTTLGISVNTARMHIKNMHSSTGTRTLLVSPPGRSDTRTAARTSDVIARPAPSKQHSRDQRRTFRRASLRAR
jgi:PAS domain S-box-containing protein